jgi:hypothetical protein
VSFYYPLTLGVRRPTPVDPKSGELPLRQSYETWREGVERYTSVYEEFPEAQVLTRLQQRAPVPRNRLWLILGEPGAGKTTLLKTWFTRWAAQLPAARLGMVVPVLVRLRHVQVEQSLHESDRWADQLWVLGLQEQALLEGQEHHIYQPDRGRWFQPVWLLDGLDEVTPPPSERFYQALVNLPGVTVVSCRTAVYETLRREADRYKDQEYELLGLKPTDQKRFLTHTLSGEARRVEALHESLQRNPQLRLLAGNPLMLNLIARVSDRMVLPVTRAAFYQAAVSELWHHRLADRPEADLRVHERDEVLTELAGRMGMAQIEAPLAWLAQAASRVAGADGPSLMAWLQHTGLVRLHPWEQVDFVHLTMQEFYLAQALRDQDLAQVLRQHWNEAHYEETLGLLIAMLFQAQQYEAIDQGLRWLVERGETTHGRTLAMLWQPRRSPLRVALRLVHRAGVPLEHLPRLADFLWEQLNRPPRHGFWGMRRRSAARKGAAARDAQTPPYILQKLAQDAEGEVRRDVAQNLNTPSEVLARLAQDAETWVCGSVAANPSTPPELLAQLAEDADALMRRDVARNPSTPPELLAQLAQDAEAEVRGSVARNPSTPPEVLARLARDKANMRGGRRKFLRMHAKAEVRQGVARNASAPPEVLVRLARDAEVQVRRGVAWSASAPPEVLAQLAEDAEAQVRQDVAENPSAPPELLAQLARDAETRVREGVARNPSAPPEVLRVE